MNLAVPSFKPLPVAVADHLTLRTLIVLTLIVALFL